MDKSAEQRTLGAACLLVRQELRRTRGGDPLGLRATHYLDTHLRIRIAGALNQVVTEFSREIDKLPAHVETFPPITQRLSVLTNHHPCEICKAVTRVAIHDIQEGKLNRVECEECAPEFLG